MDKFHQELFDMLIRCRNLGNKRESKAASLTSGIITKTNKAQVIHNFITKGL
jgi:hypothetical protein